MIKKYSVQGASWIDELIKPLGEELVEKLNALGEFNYRYDIYGPFGLSAKISIYFIPEHMNSITDNGVGLKKLSLLPNLRHNKFNYLTSEVVPNPYSEGTIGYYNHIGYKDEPLPDSIDDIFNLLQSA